MLDAATTRIAGHNLMAVLSSRFLLLVTAGVLMASCAPAGPASPTQPADLLGSAPRRSQRTLVIAIEREPASLSALPPGIFGGSTTFVVRPFNAYLDFIDNRGAPGPYLAEALPKLNTDTWQVFPDGRMQTMYRLKPNLVWQDGTPLSAEDFAFAWRASTTPGAGFGLAASPPINLMEDVSAADSRTVVIQWRRVYPNASVLQSGGSRLGLPPFPRHILEGPLREGDLEAFASHPYWTREFIGLGPYRLDRWELGSFLEAVAFDHHIFGRPKIERFRYMFIGDSGAVMANLQAGAVHVAADALTFPQALQLKREWAPTGTGTILISATSLRALLFQFRPYLVNPRAILDVRVRKALAHAIDKPSLGEALWGGEVPMMETIFAPNLEYYPLIDQAITKYPYDLRATERLMNEAGFTRGADGFYASPTEGRFAPEMKGGGGLSEHPIIASGWRQAGIDAQEAVLPRALAFDPETRSSFPAISTSAHGADEANQLAIMLTSQVGTPENRWRGENRGGWSSQEYDRLVELFNATLDPPGRIRQRVQMAKLRSEELPSIILSFNPNATAFLAALRGPVLATLGTTGLTAWNIQDWELDSTGRSAGR